MQDFVHQQYYGGSVNRVILFVYVIPCQCTESFCLCKLYRGSIKHYKEILLIIAVLWPELST